MSIVINGIKMPEAPDEMIELAILGDGTVIQTGESLRNPEDGKCYYTVTTPEKFGNAISVPEYGRLKRRVVYRGDVFNALESARIIALDDFGVGEEMRYKDGFHDGLKRALEILANEVQDVPTSIPAEEGELQKLERSISDFYERHEAEGGRVMKCPYAYEYDDGRIECIMSWYRCHRRKEEFNRNGRRICYLCENPELEESET